MFDKYLCPVCAEKNGADSAPYLTLSQNALACPRRHCFDVSARGYVNLLLPQRKNVKDPGDSKEMVLARRAFLDTGAYEPLLRALCEAAGELTEGISAPTLVDCGCGEGYYTAGLYDSLAAKGRQPEIYAVDISKNALSAAKARFTGRNISPAVASCFRLPLPNGSADMAAVVFAPFCAGELYRVLKSGGAVVTAIPARGHLYELKALLYERPYYNEVKPYETEGFEFVGKKEVSRELEIKDPQALDNLFTMTPYYYKTAPTAREKLRAYFDSHDSFKVRAEFEVLCYKKAAQERFCG